METSPAVIFDIDGTLADLEHRRKHLPDWGKFFDDMHLDEPIFPIIDLLLDMFELDKTIILCSGRSDSHREMTKDWLHAHGVHWDYLYMRKEGDYRADTIVKREILEKIRHDHDYLEIEFVVDDRQCVVDMWREAGLTCLQCAPGDFDAHNKKKFPSGKLTLLVGPSGAGKTSHMWGGPNNAELLCSEDAWLSSDNFREDLCGDFKDQTKNTQVFAAIHSIAEARLTHGLDVVIDATNLKNKDRKVFLDLAPKDCEIKYVVINRPMKDKIKYGDWRNSVSVKGKPLMEHHENVFKSNLKAILAGDDDPRVEVEDRRVS